MPRIILLGDFQQRKPAERNLGDALQHARIVSWLHRHYGDWEVETVFLFTPLPELQKQIGPDDVIAFQSSGGMGTTHLPMEAVFRQVVASYPRHRIIFFPQTVFYRDENVRRESAAVYRQHGNLTLMARDYKSHETLKFMVPDGDTLVCPDFVFSMKVDHRYLAERPDEPNAKPLLILRDDKERNEPARKAIQWSVRDADRMSLMCPETKRCRDMEHPDFWGPKLAKMAKARYLVTDRMHGMIFAAVMHIPCVCVPCGGGFPKNNNCYESWLWRVPWIEFLKQPTTETLPAAVERVLKAPRVSPVFERHRTCENSMQPAKYVSQQAHADAVGRVRTFDYWFHRWLPERLGKDLRVRQRPNVFQTRRSHRKFSPVKIGLTEACMVLLDAMAAPTAANQKSVQFWLYEPDAAFYEALAVDKFARSAGHAHILANVPRIVLVTSDGKTALPQLLLDRDVGAACMGFLLAAENRGLQSCWVTVNDTLSYVQHAREHFEQMRDDQRVVAMLPLGYSEDAPTGEDTHHGRVVKE